MSVEVMAAAWRSDIEGPTHRFVLLALADRADDDGFCWPGIANLAVKTGLSTSSVKRSIRYLEAESVLRRAPRWTTAGDQTSNMYQIDVPLLRARRAAEAPDEPSEHEQHFRSTAGGGVTVTPRSRGPYPRSV